MSSYNHRDYAASRPSFDPFLGNAGLGEGSYAFNVPHMTRSGGGPYVGSNGSNSDIASSLGDFSYEASVSPEPHSYYIQSMPSSPKVCGNHTCRSEQLGCHPQLEVSLNTQEMLIVTVVMFPHPTGIVRHRLVGWGRSLSAPKPWITHV